MPIYNNPGFGQAFENLSAMFRPPSGAEAAGWAQANGKTAENKRLAWLFENPTDATASERSSLLGIQNYGATPDGFATSNQTVLRGQDMESGDRRYGVDVGARTSILNNTADNSVVMRGQDIGSVDTQRGQDLTASTSTANNAADNDRALVERVMQENGAAARDFAKPVILNQGQTAFLPGQTAAATGLSPTLSGAPKPLSETEWQASQNERLRQSGKISDDNLADLIMGERSPVEAIGPAGSPVFMSPGAAVRTGARPAPSKPLVSVNTGEAADGKLRGKLDETEGKRLSDLQATAVTSSGLRQDLELMGELIDHAPQGPLVGRLAGLFPGASDAGAAFQSIVERAAPGLRVEGSGATSDIEFRGMLNSLPQLRNRPDANRLIAAMMQAKADINIRRGELVTAYQNEELSASQMRQQLAALNRQSITSPGLKAMIEAVGGGVEPLSRPDDGSVAPSPGTIQEGHRFKGGDPADPANWELL